MADDDLKTIAVAMRTASREGSAFANGDCPGRRGCIDRRVDFSECGDALRKFGEIWMKSPIAVPAYSSALAPKDSACHGRY